jgi:hypothetical protein
MSDPRLARKLIRSQMLFPLLLTTLAGIALIVIGATVKDEFDAWLAWMSGVVLLVLNVGVWFAMNWARLGYGILGTLLCGIAVYAFATGQRKLNLDTIDKPILWGLIAIYAYLPATKRQFMEAKSGSKESPVPSKSGAAG